MVIYIDLLFLLNIFYDTLILLTLDVTLKRRVKLKRIILGSVVGGLSTFIILLPINSPILFILKIIMGILMIIVTFKYKNIKYTFENLLYLYMISVILAGFLYYLELEFNYANYLLLLILAPVILLIYIKEQKKLKMHINYSKNISIILKNNKRLTLTGFIDSGNRIRDPVTKKYVILINKNKLKGIYNIRSPIYVPISTVNKSSLLECIGIKELIIEGRVYNNYLLGLTDYIKSDCECLLNYKLLEEL